MLSCALMVQKRKQSSPIRPLQPVHEMVEAQLKRLSDEQGVDKTAGQFVTAALIPFLKLDSAQQLEQIQRIDEALDALALGRELAWRLSRTEPAPAGPHHGRRRTGTGKG